MTASAAATSPAPTRLARPLALAALALGLVALAAALARWLLQRSALGGEGAVYTDPDRTFYVDDALLGFAQADGQWFWLGLDALGGLAAATVALSLLVWGVRRFGARFPRASLAAASLGLLAALAGLGVPLLALSSGLPPDGVHAAVPSLQAAEDAAEGSFEHGSAGRYTVATTSASTVVARVTAGGEAFDVRFEPPRGEVSFDPQALGEPLTGEFVLEVASLDSGIPLRSEHAREYLAEEAHPTIALRISQLGAVHRSADGDAVSFEATAQLDLMGATLELPLRGRIVAVDDDSERERVGLESGSAPEAWLVQAEATIDIPQTPLAGELEAFDAPTIPLTVRLLLVHEPGPAAAAQGS